ncbi:MAG TPA: chemotaxis protein CheW [Cyclobacteriaceae bacterium]|nr:chemotaxis protein CheW [Cyclobacteriaceae bacterium]
MPGREEYINIFLIEALEAYEKISSYLVSLENSPKDDKLLAEIFRNLHNLKASSSASGFSDISGLAHKLESIFSALQKQEIELNSPTMDIIYRGFDFLSILLNNIKDSVKEKQVDGALFDELDDILKNRMISEPWRSPGEKESVHLKIPLSDLISIEVRRLDALLNNIGELIINRDRIMALANKLEHQELQDLGFSLYKISNEIRQNIMDARLVNLGILFNKFPRIVRDMAAKENKQVNLDMTGLDIRIDRNILQIISDSMLHLIRNTISHGIETEIERKKKNKPLSGNLTITATSKKGLVNIKVADDGNGIDTDKIREQGIAAGIIPPEKSRSMREFEILPLIFEPGFSLSTITTEHSGRGMGLNIVKEAIDSIGGTIKVISKKNKGTIFDITLPTSITVVPALLFKVREEFYAIPLFHILKVQSVSGGKKIHMWDDQLFFVHRGETIPLVILNRFLYGESDLPDNSGLELNSLNIILVEHNNRKIGVVPDLLLIRQNIVIKPLKKPMRNHKLFGGVTILGTGSICYLFDIPSMLRAFKEIYSMQKIK